MPSFILAWRGTNRICPSPSYSNSLASVDFLKYFWPRWSFMFWPMSGFISEMVLCHCSFWHRDEWVANAPRHLTATPWPQRLPQILVLYALAHVQSYSKTALCHISSWLGDEQIVSDLCHLTADPWPQGPSSNIFTLLVICALACVRFLL